MKNYAIAIAIVAVILMMRSPPKTVVVQPSSDHKILDSLRLKIEKIEALITLMKDQPAQVLVVDHSQPLTDLDLVEVSKPAEKPLDVPTVEIKSSPPAVYVEPTKPVKPAAPVQPKATQPVYYRQYSNCANGNCGRVGLFGRRR